MSDRKLANPWSSRHGFVDLGSFEENGVTYELYCYPSKERVEDKKEQDVVEIGARFSEHRADHSAVLLDTRKDGITRKVCYGYEGPIIEALARMGKRGLLTETIFDVTDRVLYRPGSNSDS